MITAAARRAIAIRKSTAARAAANDNEGAPKRATRTGKMPAALLAACIDAGGFDQNARYA